MLREHKGGDTHSFLRERNHMPAWPLDVQTLPTTKEHYVTMSASPNCDKYGL